MLIVDSSTKWCGSLTMAQRALTAHPLLEAYHYVAPASFVLPTEAEWKVIKDIYFGLKDLWDCVLSWRITFP